MRPDPSPELVFRTAGASDALCIGVLATQVFLDTYATDGIRPSLAQEVLEQLSTNSICALFADPATSFIVAERAQHMVAFAQLTFGSIQPLAAVERAVELNRLYVQGRFTAKGIGKALLHRAEGLAASRGASTLWLTVWTRNQRALAFYASQQYQDVGSTMYVFQEEQFENRVLAKPLQGQTTPGPT